TVTDRFVSPSVEVDGTLAMVHLRVGDADRAMRFFGALFGWQAERVPFEGHISHYTVNTDLTLRILDDPSAPPVVPNYRVTDVDGAVRSIERAGGRVEASEVTPDGGGWVRGEDDQGVPLLLFRPGRYHRSAPPAQAASGEVGLVFIRADAGRAERFYRATLGWHLERVHPASSYWRPRDARGQARRSCRWPDNRRFGSKRGVILARAFGLALSGDPVAPCSQRGTSSRSGVARGSWYSRGCPEGRPSWQGTGVCGFPSRHDASSEPQERTRHVASLCPDHRSR